jgi:hypothetical protein
LRRNNPHWGAGWPRLSGDRTGVGRRHCIKQILVRMEIEHHVHAVAILAEIFHIGFGKDVGFSENDGVTLPPLQKFTQRAKHVVLLDPNSASVGSPFSGFETQDNGEQGSSSPYRRSGFPRRSGQRSSARRRYQAAASSLSVLAKLNFFRFSFASRALHPPVERVANQTLRSAVLLFGRLSQFFVPAEVARMGTFSAPYHE